MNIYFCGIGGAGLMPLAELALDAGWNVTGSDGVESLNTKELEKRKVKFSLNQDGEFLKKVHGENPIEWFVYSSAIKPTHPEFMLAKDLGIKMSKRDGLLNLILEKKKLKMLAVAGTHGKTTTTGMLIWLFKSFDKPVSYSVGSNISFGPAANYEEGSQYFVYECDEFDRNFLNFKPEFSLITSLDHDHIDTYPTEENYFEAFSEFLNKNSEQGVVWREYQDKISKFGFKIEEKCKVFNVNDVEKELSAIKLLGLHNRKNAFLAIQIFKNIFPELAFEEIVKKMNNFPGTQRRQEKLAENVYTDYAHHPEEIRSTVQLFKELNKPVSIIYQPHQNIRQHHIQNEYKDCFVGVNKLYWLPTYLSREDGQEILTPEFLMNKATGDFHKETAEMNDKLVEKLQNDLKNGHILVFLGAGDIDGFARKNFLK